MSRGLLLIWFILFVLLRSRNVVLLLNMVMGRGLGILMISLGFLRVGLEVMCNLLLSVMRLRSLSCRRLILLNRVMVRRRGVGCIVRRMFVRCSR